MFLLTELTRSGACYKNECTRPKSGTSKKSYENTLWTNGISWISASSTKPLESGERDFELVRLQEGYSLSIRCEHFLLLTFCIVLFLKSRLCWLFAGWLKCASCATMCNCISTKMLHKNFLTNKHMRILWPARIFPNQWCDTIFVKIYPYVEKLQQKKQKGADFMEHGLQFLTPHNNVRNHLCVHTAIAYSSINQHINRLTYSEHVQIYRCRLVGYSRENCTKMHHKMWF